MTDSRKERLERIGAKLSYIQQEKPKSYVRDEQSLSTYERELDGQIRRIRRWKGETGIPDGIRAAERGR